MGYYTHHNMAIVKPGQLTEEEAHDRLIGLLDKYDILGYAVDKELECQQAVKWYNEEEDMIKITAELGNDVVVMVEGDGEDSDDQWRSYYKNGVLLETVGKIWEPVDLDKL